MEKYINDSMIKEIDGQFGKYHEVKINLKELEALANTSGEVFLRLYKRKIPDSNGNTHYFVMNENGHRLFGTETGKKEDFQQCTQDEIDEINQQNYEEEQTRKKNEENHESYDDRLESNGIPRNNVE